MSNDPSDPDGASEDDPIDTGFEDREFGDGDGFDQLTVLELPSALPIFPLTGAILMPGCELPLNIFEPRYLEMVKNARENQLLIGMVQPTEPNSQAQKPEVYPIGGAGLIHEYQETDDGRVVITLVGISRFMIRDELAVTTPYRQVRPVWGLYASDIDCLSDMPTDRDITDKVDRQTLLDSLMAYLALKGLSCDLEAINKAPDTVLVNNLAMMIPFQPAEKQALLEADTIGRRGDLLTALMQMACSANDDSQSVN